METSRHIHVHTLFLSFLCILLLPVTAGYLLAEQPSFFPEACCVGRCNLALQAAATTVHFLITGKTVHRLLLKLTCYILVPCLCWLMSSLRQKGRKEKKKSSVRKLASYSQSSPEFTLRKRKRIKIFKSFYEKRYQIFTKIG